MPVIGGRVSVVCTLLAMLVWRIPKLAGIHRWMFLQGIETLPLRMERHCENALKVAQYLKGEWRRIVSIIVVLWCKASHRYFLITHHTLCGFLFIAIPCAPPEHPKVEWVRFPGLEDDPEYEKNLKYLNGKGGSLVVFELKGGAASGRKFIDSLQLLSHVANVGDAKSLAINPSTTTHSQLNEEQQQLAGITPGMVRLSIGIETIDDILADIQEALDEA